MNFGFVLAIWVMWTCLHGAVPNIPKPENFGMFLALTSAYSLDVLAASSKKAKE